MDVMLLLSVIVMIGLLLIYWYPVSEAFLQDPFRSGYDQVYTSAGEVITGVIDGDTAHLYYTWNGKTYDTDWYVCGLPSEVWEYILFPRRTSSLLVYYSRSPEEQRLMSLQARYVRRGTFDHSLYVLQPYMGNTHMRKVNAWTWQIMGRPATTDMYMGMAPPVHPYKQIYEMKRVKNPPNISLVCCSKK